MDAPLFTDEWRDRTLIRPRHDLAETLRGLVREQGVLTAMTEAGGVFSAALFEAGLVDEVVIYYAPMLCGGPVPALAGAGLPQCAGTARKRSSSVSEMTSASAACIAR